MLIKDFYELISTTPQGEDAYEVVVNLNKDSTVYAGHFPDQPVAPGVCLTQMVKEVANGIIGKNWALREVRQIKFLAMVDPNQTPSLTLDLKLQPSDNDCKLTCTAKDGETSYFKIIGTLS